MNFKLAPIPTEFETKIYVFSAPLIGRVDEFAREALSQNMVKVVVNLLSEEERIEHQFDNQRESYSSKGIRLIDYPIQDYSLPEDSLEFLSLAKNLSENIREGLSIGIHCMGGIGRSSLLTVSILYYLGLRVDDALQHVKKHRGCSVPDTEEQVKWMYKNLTEA